MEIISIALPVLNTLMIIYLLINVYYQIKINRGVVRILDNSSIFTLKNTKTINEILEREIKNGK